MGLFMRRFKLRIAHGEDSSKISEQTNSGKRLMMAYCPNMLDLN